MCDSTSRILPPLEQYSQSISGLPTRKMSAAHATEPACTTANCPPTAHTCDAHKGTEHKADAAACAHCDDAKATAHGKTAGETIKGAAVQTGKVRSAVVAPVAGWCARLGA